MNTCKKCGRELPDGALFGPFCGVRQVRAAPRKQRGNGTGYAYQRGKTWTLCVTVGWTVDANGKPKRLIRRKGGYPTKTEALRHVEELKAAPVRKAPTLAELWKIYYAGPFEKLGASKQTAYKIAWGKLADISAVPVDMLSIQALNECVSKKAPTFYPARDMKTVLGKLWDYALAEQYVTVRLPDFIELPKLEEDEPEPFVETEIHSFWRGYAAGDTMAGYILLMIYTGMMPGELIGLKMDMIDWERKEIIGAGLKTKVRKGTPLVLADVIIPVLDDLCQKSQSKKGKVLCMNKDKFYEEYYACLERNNCRKLPPYSCRHTTGTALALAKNAPSVIQKFMRHAKFSTTQRYIHPDVTSMKEAANSLQLIGSGQKRCDTLCDT